MEILSLILLIFAIFLIKVYVKFKPNIDTIDGKYILWFNVVSKTGEVRYRDYIELF